MIQEFYLSITPVGNETYLVRTERVAPGVPLAEEQVRWPVDKWLAQAGHLMNDPLLTILQSDTSSGHLAGSSPTPESFAPNLVTLGQEFYNILFQGTIRDSWMTAQGIAYHRRESLRLRLGLKGDRLPRLPWEVLHAGNRPIATGTDIVFSRYQPTSTSLVLPLLQRQAFLQEGGNGSQSGQLNILMVIAAPLDQESLELKQEVSQLQQELQQPLATNGRATAQAPQIQLTILEQPDREHLTQALEQGHYQVLHYAGHSNLAAAGGNLYLVNRRTGLTETLSGDDLAGLLVNNGIHMAVFNSCRGAYTATGSLTEDRGERSLAEALVLRGIPAVLAMAEQIPDEVALTLTRLFYRNLRQGYPVDLSVSRARQGLVSAYGSQQLYWALPILYMHPEFDGYLALMEGRHSDISDHGSSSSPPVAYPHPQQPVVPRQPYGVTSSARTAAPSQPAQDPIVPTPIESSTDFPFLTVPSGMPTGNVPVVRDFVTRDVSGNPSVSDAAFTSDRLMDLSAESDQELGDLIDDLEYVDELNFDETRPSVSDLIRRLSQGDTEPEVEGDEPLIPASNFEDLLPGKFDLQPSGYLALDLPENPLYRAKDPAPAPVLVDLQLISFNSFEWQVKDFIKVPFVPFVAWRSAVVRQMQLPSTLGNNSLNGYGMGENGQSQGLLTGNSTAGNVLSGGRPAFQPPKNLNATKVSDANAALSRGSLLSFLWPLLAGVGTTLIVLAGIRLLPGLKVAQQSPRPTASSQPRSSPSASPQATQPPRQGAPNILVEQGLVSLRQGNLAEGQRVVEKLLDQQALAEAAQVLAEVSPAQAKQPAIQFLKGRLALQAIKTGQSGYSLTEAKQAFEAAFRGNPDSLPYHNALGLTAYVMGDLNRVKEVVFSAGYLISEQEDAGKPVSFKQKDVLTFHALLALVSLKSQQKQEALNLRDEVLRQQAASFQPDVLAKEWMWPSQAVQDWQKLVQL